ncbi:MAG: 16S rRNA (uracil(1498)-N(3))-methyltransferase [Micrococcales bacterium]|nr:16S rRNA (uracil(1498)-N(3))-methyltransferase [Micrococcales bacterium]
MTAPLFYVDHLPRQGQVTVTGDEARHATVAMRLHVGEAVLVGDGRGGLADCVVGSVDRRQGLVAAVRTHRHVPAPRAIVVVQAVPKGERAELAVELLTECGVTAVVPWQSQRTVPDWGDKREVKRQRWQRVARAAAKQSRRAWIPEVAEVQKGLPVIQGAGLILHEDADERLYDLDPPPGPVTVVVGPEGGLDDDEVEGLVAAGAVPVRMGPEILRTSTAGAAACMWLRGLEMRLGA